VNVFKVGVVGIGDISDVYLANLATYGDTVEVVGCAGRDLAKARSKAAVSNTLRSRSLRFWRTVIACRSTIQ